MKHTGNNEKFIQNFWSEERGDEPLLGYSGVGERIILKGREDVVFMNVAYGRFQWRSVVSSIPVTRFYSRRAIS